MLDSFQCNSTKVLFDQLISELKGTDPTSFGSENEEKIPMKEINSDGEDREALFLDMFTDPILQIPSDLRQTNGAQQDGSCFELLVNLQDADPLQSISEPIFQDPGQKKQDPLFNRILSESVFSQKNGNTIRFLIDVLIEYLPQYSQEYSVEAGSKMMELCEQTRTWHLLRKKNVYNRDHLEKFFGDHYEKTEKCAGKTRELFNKILRTYGLEAMKKPKSQIKDKVHYLRVAKIFALRCRSNKLSQRNQSR